MIVMSDHGSQPGRERGQFDFESRVGDFADLPVDCSERFQSLVALKSKALYKKIHMIYNACTTCLPILTDDQFWKMNCEFRQLWII